jgi:hypothetical protein
MKLEKIILPKKLPPVRIELTEEEAALLAKLCGSYNYDHMEKNCGTYYKEVRDLNDRLFCWLDGEGYKVKN